LATKSKTAFPISFSNREAERIVIFFEVIIGGEIVHIDIPLNIFFDPKTNLITGVYY